MPSLNSSYNEKDENRRTANEKDQRNRSKTILIPLHVVDCRLSGLRIIWEIFF
jgi:hypothetical protein